VVQRKWTPADRSELGNLRRLGRRSRAARPQADDFRQAEMGFTIAAEHQRHGSATEAVSSLLGYLLEQRQWLASGI
jgi:RimJ/RimL family protein N-acetyltransferase